MNSESVRMFVIQEPLKHKPKCRVELHVHLDGALRHETIWEILRQKKLELPGNGSLAALKKALTIHEPSTLDAFLCKFSIFLPAIIDDLQAIERISYEFVEDLSLTSVAYAEARLCPQLLLTKYIENVEETSTSDCTKLTLESVLEASLAGLKKGEVDFGTKVCLILCCIRGRTEWSWEILRLCEEFKDKGVVGIDIAGDVSDDIDSGESKNLADAEVFNAAHEKGIHITVHAGEEGDAKSVLQALDVLHAERIGHGYRVIEDEEIYQKCLDDKVHFEVCPHSSYYTGAIKSFQTASKRHPVLKFAEDGASFSINTDDPTVTGTCLDDEYKLLQSWGLTEAHFTRANFEAAQNCFLPQDEKVELINQLTKAYGIPVFKAPSLVSPTEKEIKSDAVKPIIKMASWEDRS